MCLCLEFGPLLCFLAPSPERERRARRGRSMVAPVPDATVYRGTSLGKKQPPPSGTPIRPFVSAY